MLTVPGPVMCNPPPFPGEVKTVFEFNVTPFKFIKDVPAVAFPSIPPPALLAVFPVIVELFTFNVAPTSFKIPPPEPEVPLAILLVIVALVIVNVPLIKL